MRNEPIPLMQDDLQLLVLDSLQGLVGIEPVAPAALAATPHVLTPAQAFERLRVWQADFEAGQASATLKAVRADWGQYLAWCQGTGHPPLPASLEQLVKFLTNAIDRGRKRTTVARYLYTVSLIHDAAGLPNPAKDRRWPLTWKALTKRLKATGGSYRRQAGALVAADVARILATLGDDPRSLRDAALLSLASDTLLREAELVAVKVKHLQPDAHRTNWSLWVPSSKTDQEGLGDDYRYVSAATLARIRRWLTVAGITEGYVFRGIGGRKRAAVVAAEAAGREAPVLGLTAKEVARIFRQRAVAAGLDHGWTISGHSTRIGTANDLMRDGASTGEIQLAGGWKSEAMVIAYTRKSRAGNDAVARLRRSSTPAK
jgi:integrase